MPRKSPRDLYCLIATMPKSGTWYSFFFFEYLNLFLTGKGEVRKRPTTYRYDGLGITKAHAHLMCPGFLESYLGDSRAAWDALQFRTPGINSGFGPLAIEQGHRFDPQQNPDVRIAYLYRNPLDQAVSHYRHLFWLEKQIQPVAFRAGLNDWMRKDAIESYLKQYFSYYAMTQSHPSNVIRICYEDLFRTPAAVFKRLAQFFDFTIQTDGELKAFLRALWATTPQAMRMLERKQGHAFGDSNAKNDSHLHGGEVGKWRRWLDDTTVQYAQKRFEALGLSLRDFVTT
jgi:hypothetical protein